MLIEPIVVWDLGALLGEGPAWFPDEGALRFVDIKRGHLHRFSPTSGDKGTLELGGLPSFVVAEQGGGLLVGAEHGIHRLNAGGYGECVAKIDQPTRNRTNDATVDGYGRLWFGTMDNDETNPSGVLWCLDQGTLHCMGGEAVVTNGPAITTDGKTLYHVDSAARIIWRFSIGAGHSIERREVFLELDEVDGHPDGVVLDCENCLWVALWDGWGVRRYAPDGELLLHVSFPCARVTKLAFGGPDLRTAFVTTARIGLGERDLAQQPMAGSLFAFDAGVSGRILPAVRLA